MSLFSGAVHSVTHVFNQVERPVGNLFGNSALGRALLNPADPIAVGQTLNNTVVQGQSPQKQAATVVASGQRVIATAGAYHQDLWNNITDGVHWLGGAILRVYRGLWGEVKHLWGQVGGQRVGNKLGANIHSTVQKWGGERRVAAWTEVVIVVIVVVIIEWASWGSATPAIGAGGWSLITALLSFGVQQGLTPDQPAPGAISLFARGDTIDNSRITSITDLGGSSGGAQSGSTLQQLLDGLGLGNLPAIAVVGIAAAGIAGLYFLLRR